MKTSFPLNSMSSRAATNHVGAGLVKAMKRFASAILVLLPGALMFFACTSVARSADSDTQGKTVVFVPGVMGNAFYVTMERGIRAEAAKYGFKVDIQGAQQFDPTLQTPIVNAVVASKPAGVLIAPTDSKGMFSPIPEGCGPRS